MRIIISALLLTALATGSAKAYFHCYTDSCDKVRLNDKIARLEKNLAKSSDEFKAAKIKIEIEEAKFELASKK